MTAAIRVLYVDDEQGLSDLGKVFLEKNGEFTVSTLTSAREAISFLKDHPVDAIISDYQMPEMAGIGFLKSRPG